MTHPVCPSVAPKSSRMVGIATLVIEPFITITPTASATTSSNDRTGTSPAGRVFCHHPRRRILSPQRPAWVSAFTGDVPVARGSRPVPSSFDVGQEDGSFSLVVGAFESEHTIATIKLPTNGREGYS